MRGFTNRLTRRHLGRAFWNAGRKIVARPADFGNCRSAHIHTYIYEYRRCWRRYNKRSDCSAPFNGPAPYSAAVPPAAKRKVTAFFPCRLLDGYYPRIPSFFFASRVFTCIYTRTRSTAILAAALATRLRPCSFFHESNETSGFTRNVTASLNSLAIVVFILARSTVEKRKTRPGVVPRPAGTRPRSIEKQNDVTRLIASRYCNRTGLRFFLVLARQEPHERAPNNQADGSFYAFITGVRGLMALEAQRNTRASALD